MQKGSKIYSLEAITADPLATRNTILFAALTALGIPPEPTLCGEFVETTPGQPPRSITVWRLREKSICGKYTTRDLLKKWHDPAFVSREPEHPLAYIKTAFENQTRARAFIADHGPIAMRRRGKKIALITRHTPTDRKRRILDELNK